MLTSIRSERQGFIKMRNVYRRCLSFISDQATMAQEQKSLGNCRFSNDMTCRRQLQLN